MKDIQELIDEMDEKAIHKQAERARQTVEFCPQRMKGNWCGECNMLDALIAADDLLKERNVELAKLKGCDNCANTGLCDDAEAGDIMFNKWTCPECNGKPFEPRN